MAGAFVAACGSGDTKSLSGRANPATIDGADAAAPPPDTPTAVTTFDADLFASSVQPILDDAESKGCTNASCHGAGAGGLSLVHGDAKANLPTVIPLVDLTSPETSTLLVRGAAPRHGGGGSVVFSDAERATILAWIQKAKASTGKIETKPGCTPASAFNAGVFRSEILPILMGDVDLNRPGKPASTGCAKSVCHGQERDGALVLRRTLSVEQNLANFACQVDLESPTSSPILACPLGDPRCVKPHPGGPVWSGADDHNYQRVLSWLFAAKGASHPIDFAYFVRNVEPMFDDQTLLAAPKSCASTQGCHGVATSSQLPPNKSNFPILGTPGDKAAHRANFQAAMNFLNFVQPEGSALFQFPTNQVANPAANGNYALGLAHGGGQVIASDSPQAKAILAWARGLRLAANGNQPNWLVAGDYPGLLTVDDKTALDEKAVLPRIFDVAAGAQSGSRTWDSLSANDAGRLDLAGTFTRTGGTDAIYAAAYLLNTSSNDKPARIRISSSNAVLVSAAGAAIAVGNGNGDALGTTTLKARSSIRILVKVLRAANDPNFGFSMSITNDNGQPFADDGQIIVKLDPEGGI